VGKVRKKEWILERGSWRGDEDRRSWGPCLDSYWLRFEERKKRGGLGDGTGNKIEWRGGVKEDSCERKTRGRIREERNGRSAKSKRAYFDCDLMKGLSWQEGGEEVKKGVWEITV